MSRQAADQILRTSLQGEGQDAQAVALIAHFSNNTDDEQPTPFRLAGLSAHGRKAVHIWAESCGRSLLSHSDGRDAAGRCVTVERRPLRDVVSWLSGTARALNLEQEADAAELEALASATDAECERRGISILDLQVRECDATGPGGRPRLVLISSRGGRLPAHKLSHRSEVELTGQGKTGSIRAIVSRTAADELEIVASDASLCRVLAFLDESSPKLRVDARAGDVTHVILKETLKHIKRFADDPPNPLTAALLRHTSFSDLDSPPCNVIRSNETASPLNKPQLDAVAAALCTPPALCVHGPPGTGKTTTVAEIILQCAARGERILACAPSNIAVDTLLEYVSRHIPRMRRSNDHKKKISLLRLGHPARLAPEVFRYSLESRIEKGDAAAAIQDARSELEELENNRKHREARAVRAEIRRRERRAAHAVVSASSVVFSTLVGAAKLKEYEDEKNDGKKPFDVVIIDEAAQALEIACWIPLLWGERCILAGDHKQLAPTVKTRDTHAARCLSSSLFESLIRAGCPSIMLTTQYRMHRDISDWASDTSYHGRLSPDSSCAARSLDGFAPIAVIDTCGCDMYDDWNPHSGDEHGVSSISNQREADVVVGVVKRLLRRLRPSDVCVIAPYNAQVALLRERLLSTGVECRTVDGFQGGEREAVVLSLTRSNKKKVIGFLGDERRLNVAVTRAKRHISIVCDSDTVRKSPFIANLLDYVTDRGEYVYCADDILVKGEARDKPPHLGSKVRVRRKERARSKGKSSACGAHVDARSAAPSAAPPAAPVATPVDISGDAPSNALATVPVATRIETSAAAAAAPSDRTVKSDAPGNQTSYPATPHADEVATLRKLADVTLDDQPAVERPTFRVVFQGETHRVAAASTSLADLQSALVAQFGIPVEKHKLIGAGLQLGADSQLVPNQRVLFFEKPDTPPAPPSKNAKKKARRRERAALAARLQTEKLEESVPPESAVDNSLLASLAADRRKRDEQQSQVAEPSREAHTVPTTESSSADDDDAFLDAQIRRAQFEAASQRAIEPPWCRWFVESGPLHNSSGFPSVHTREQLAKLLQMKIAQVQHKNKQFRGKL